MHKSVIDPIWRSYCSYRKVFFSKFSADKYTTVILGLYLDLEDLIRDKGLLFSVGCSTYIK